MTAAAALASPVHDAGGAMLGGSALVIGGGQRLAGSSVQRLATTGNTATVGRLPAPRADLSALSVAGELLVIGGGTASGPDSRVRRPTACDFERSPDSRWRSVIPQSP